MAQPGPLFEYAQAGQTITFPIVIDLSGLQRFTSVNIDNQTAATLTFKSLSGRHLRIIGPYTPRSYTLNQEFGFELSSDGTAILATDYLNIEAAGAGYQISPF